MYIYSTVVRNSAWIHPLLVPFYTTCISLLVLLSHGLFQATVASPSSSNASPDAARTYRTPVFSLRVSRTELPWASVKLLACFVLLVSAVMTWLRKVEDATAALSIVVASVSSLAEVLVSRSSSLGVCGFASVNIFVHSHLVKTASLDARDASSCQCLCDLCISQSPPTRNICSESCGRS
jgi:cell shape-determining protein MreD